MRSILPLILLSVLSVSCSSENGGGGFEVKLIYPDNDLKVGDGSRIVGPTDYVCVHKGTNKSSGKGTCVAPVLEIQPKIEQKSPAGTYKFEVLGSVNGFVEIPVKEGQKLSSITDSERIGHIQSRLVCRADTIQSGISCLHRNSHYMHGSISSCSIQADNRVKCWGRSNSEGQLGKGFYGSDIDLDNLSPSLTIEHDLKLKAISSSEAAFCGIDHEDEIVCWGDIEPLTGLPMTNSPTKVLSGVKAKTVSISETALCIVDSSDSILCAGRNDFGQLGNGTTTPNFNLSPVSGDLKARRVELGQKFVCAHLLNDNLACWGEGADGKLGNGLEDDSLIPVVQTSNKILQVSVGRSHACIIDFDSKLECFGDNSMGQLAQGHDYKMVTRSDTPIFGEHAVNIRKVIAGYWSTCVEAQNRKFFCVGGEKVNYGLLEVGTSFIKREVFSNQNVQSIYPTKYHIIGRLTNGLTIVRGKDNGDGVGGTSAIDNVIPFKLETMRAQ